ncbi:MAG: site-specific integrase [Prevotella sp.]|nr:site-specific integrase [Alistipes senegalensis]MCM1358361.1 site-specific integrase [Prevotella sp.]MCM1473833.1 site-specific integrase [Muribaculaceae bacterium]
MKTKRGHHEGSIKLRKDGRYEVRATADIDYETGKKKRISRYAQTRTEAIQILHELEYQIHCTEQIDPTSTTLLGWLRLWLETYKKSNLKQSTYVSYTGYIEKHIASAFPKTKLKDLTARDLQDFYNYKIYTQGLSPKTVINIHRCLHEALKQAVLEHYIVFNPSDAVVLPKNEKPEIEIMTLEEQKKVIEASYQFRYGIFIRLTLCTGIRLGELLGLTWENTDLRSGTLFIRQTLNRLNKVDYNGVGDKTEIVIQSPKTKNSIRSIPLLPFIVKELQNWRNIQNDEKEMAGDNYQDSGMVVTNQLGGYVEPRTFKDYYNQILEAAGVGHFTFHALRHTFASRAMEQDMDAKTLSSILGHYSVAFTLDTYAHVLDNHKREEMMLMGNLFESLSKPQNQNTSYPVIVTPAPNGFIMNAVDFENLSIQTDNIQHGLNCIQSAITKKLMGTYPPVPTPYSELILNTGEFIIMVNI